MISAVICTRDRAVKLERCLEHLAHVSRSFGLPWQLVIIDNGSIDATRDVVHKFASRLPLKYAFERLRGLSHARNRGIVEADQPIIAFTDDDCLVDPRWLPGIVAEFGGDPALSVLAGRVEPADPGDRDVSQRMHVERVEIDSFGQLLHFMSGCNMAFRRTVFERVGSFDANLGKGRRAGSGEDLDMFYRALRQGCKLVYTPVVRVSHAHGRDTEHAMRHVEQEYVRGRGAFYAKFIDDPAVARSAYWEVRGLAGDCLSGRRPGRALALLGGLAFGAMCGLVSRLRRRAPVAPKAAS